MTRPDAPRRRLLVVADSDSYLKWGAALASTLPKERWRTHVAVIRTPVAPSERQLADALAGSRFDPDDVSVVRFEGLDALVDAIRPEVVLLALRGPFVRVVAPRLLRRADRPVLLSGFPGLTIPAVRKAVVYREQTDLIVLHSRREVRDFAELAAGLGIGIRFGLATLPFLKVRGGPKPAPAGPGPTAASTGTVGRAFDVVFAAQAKVPAAREDRVRLLAWLAEHGRRHPEHRVVVKVRARAGEAQTHAETYDYADLLAEVGAPPNLVVEDGPMGGHLARAGALVTVSSTAAIEAVAAGVPVLLVDDFGIGAPLINTVFVESGLFGDADDLVSGRWRRADPAWRRDNYFHGAEADDWIARVEELAAERDAAPLPMRPRSRDRAGGALRAVYDRRRMLGEDDRSVAGLAAMAVGRPARWLVRRARRMLRRGPVVEPVSGRRLPPPAPERSRGRSGARARPGSSARRSAGGRDVLGDMAEVRVAVSPDPGALVVGERTPDLAGNARDQ